MRTTVDIPDETYRAIKIMAAQRGTTVRELVLEGLEAVKWGKTLTPRRQFEIPVISSSRTDKLVIDNEKIHDLIDFS
jgi:hypothetical protein